MSRPVRYIQVYTYYTRAQPIEHLARSLYPEETATDRCTSLHLHLYDYQYVDVN